MTPRSNSCLEGVVHLKTSMSTQDQLSYCTPFDHCHVNYASRPFEQHQALVGTLVRHSFCLDKCPFVATCFSPLFVSSKFHLIHCLPCNIYTTTPEQFTSEASLQLSRTTMWYCWSNVLYRLSSIEDHLFCSACLLHYVIASSLYLALILLSSNSRTSR